MFENLLVGLRFGKKELVRARPPDVRRHNPARIQLSFHDLEELARRKVKGDGAVVVGVQKDQVVFFARAA